jgi:hypothetical protein
VKFSEANQGYNGGTALSNSWGWGTSNYWVNVSYATLKNALQSTGDTALPTTDPNPAGGKDWYLPEAYARMLGLSTATPNTSKGQFDDTVTLNTWFNTPETYNGTTYTPWSYGQDVINGLIHELSEGLLGRVGGLGDQNSVWSTMDLFRYSAANTPEDYTDGRDGKTTYFSSDGTNLSSAAGLSFYNQYSLGSKGSLTYVGGDTADWTQQAVFGTTGGGETLTLNQTELNVMAALGWKVSLPQAVFTARSDLWQTATAWGQGFAPITPQDALIGLHTTPPRRLSLWMVLATLSAATL